jgi:hypothetical protein
MSTCLSGREVSTPRIASELARHALSVMGLSTPQAPASRAVSERLHAHVRQHLEHAAQLLAAAQRRRSWAQPFAKDQVGTRQQRLRPRSGPTSRSLRGRRPRRRRLVPPAHASGTSTPSAQSVPLSRSENPSSASAAHRSPRGKWWRAIPALSAAVTVQSSARLGDPTPGGGGWPRRDQLVRSS